MATLPPITCVSFAIFRIALTAPRTPSEWPCRIDNDDICAGLDQRFGLAPALVPGAGRGDKQPASLVLGRHRVIARLFDILHGDQTDAAGLRVDDHQLLDPVFVEQLLGIFLRRAFTVITSRVIRSQTFCVQVTGKAHVTVGQDADQPVGRCPRHRPQECR